MVSKKDVRKNRFRDRTLEGWTLLHRLCIVGMGLMGGAVGSAARRSGAVTRVIGVADNQQTIDAAKRIGAVDEATLDLQLGVRDADLVLLAVPVRLIPEVAAAVIPACRDGAILTDLGSTKSVVVSGIEALISRLKAPVQFVGSHPLTGSEKTGVTASSEVQLEGATCVLTPTPSTDNEAYRQVDDFWKSLGMKTMRLAPSEHDAVLARSSHLPHLLAYALVHAQSERSMTLSGPGLRDMTRLAGSEASLWVDVFAQNATELAKVVREFGEEVVRLSEEVAMLEQAGTPGAESARERLFRFLADARLRHDRRYEKDAEPESRDEDANEDETSTTPVGDDDFPRPRSLRDRDTEILPPGR